MGYIHAAPPEIVYHYTQRQNLDQIITDQRIRRMGDTECWFCASLEDTLELMRRTVMREGAPYYGIGGILRFYPPFRADDYVILKLQAQYPDRSKWVRWMQALPSNATRAQMAEAQYFSNLKIGYRGDFRFVKEPQIIEVAPLLSGLEQGLSFTI